MPNEQLESGFSKLLPTIVKIAKDRIDFASTTESKDVGSLRHLVEDNTNKVDIFDKIELEPLEKIAAGLSKEEYQAVGKAFLSGTYKTSSEYLKAKAQILDYAKERGVSINANLEIDGSRGSEDFFDVIIGRAQSAVDAQRDGGFLPKLPLNPSVIEAIEQAKTAAKDATKKPSELVIPPNKTEVKK